MRFLALLSLIAGMWGAISSLAELMGGVRADRALFISRVRDRQLALYDSLQASTTGGQPAAAPAPTGAANPPLPSAMNIPPADAGSPIVDAGAPMPDLSSAAGSLPASAPAAQGTGVQSGGTPAGSPLLMPLLRLPRTEVEHLSLLLGGELYEHLPVTVPLALLKILLSWLLLTGSLGVLRRQSWALSLWSWACMVNLPFSMLSLLVTLVHSRTLRDSFGPQVAQALAKVSGRSVEAEQYYVNQLIRLYVGGQGALLALWALLLGGTALYLQRYVATGRRS